MASASTNQAIHHPNTHLSMPVAAHAHLSIPTVDLSSPRPITVDRIRSASRDWGFFQIINHGIPLSTMENTLSAVRSFHELPTAVRSKYYTCESNDSVKYYLSKGNLFQSTAASRRGTLQITFSPTPADLDRIPEVCRSELVKWDESVKEVARELMEMICEGLGVNPRRLEELTCLEGREMSCHYYTPSPESDRTFATGNHTDPTILTAVLQDRIGGLEVKRLEENGEEFWVRVKPTPGALVISVGDILQILSNDEFKSAHHRARAFSSQEPRVSVACFFSPGKNGESTKYEPLPELISNEKPTRYKSFAMPTFIERFLKKEFNNKTLIHFKV